VTGPDTPRTAGRDPGEAGPKGDERSRGAGSQPSGIRPSETPGSRRRVILVTGPSGAGKSRLATRLSDALGWPVVRLDDFYREVDDPGLPRSPLGIPDWDHIDSWDVHAAVAALRTLVDTGSAEVPIYDIGASRVTGRQVVACAPDDFVLAEGLFAARLTEPLEAERLLADALCVRRWRWVTFVLRLVRDLAERRKPPHILLRRGVALFRAEPAIIAQAEAHGARCVSPREAESQVRALVAGGPRR
jgi:Uridine kinase